MKKYLSLVMSCVLLFSMLSISAYAAEVDNNEPPVVTEEYAYLSNCWAGLKSTGGGYYNVTGGAGSAVANVSISVTVILQRYEATSTTGWVDIATWSDYAQWSASAGGSRYIATSGVYRTHVIANVYKEDGTLGETETANSDHITIP